MGGTGRRSGRRWGQIRPDNEPALRLAEFLRDKVNRSGKTLAVLSEEINLSATQISTYLGGRVPPQWFVTSLVAATVPPHARERCQKEAATLLHLAENPLRTTAPARPSAAVLQGRPVELVLAQQVETYERLTRSLEQQAELRQAADHSARLIWVLLGMIHQLEKHVTALSRERDRLRGSAAREALETVEAKLARAQAQQAAADHELRRAEEKKRQAEHSADRLQRQITELTAERDRLRGDGSPPAGHLLGPTGSPRIGPEPASADPEADDIDAALVRAAEVNDTDGTTIDRITKEIGDASNEPHAVMDNPRRRTPRSEPVRRSASIKRDDLPPIREYPEEPIFSLVRFSGIDELVQNHSRALQRDPEDVAALVNRGLRFHTIDQYDMALADLNRALQLEPDSATALFHRAGVLQKTDRYDEALSDLDRAHRLLPGNAFVLARRGEVHMSLDRLPEALADFTQAVDLAPENISFLTRRGSAYHRSKRLFEALDDFTRVVEAEPDNADALTDRGVLCTDLDRFAAALIDFDRALMVKPEHLEAILQRGRLNIRMHRYREALTDLDKVIKKVTLPAGLVLRSEAHFRLGNFEEALSDVDQALASDDSDLHAPCYCVRASVYAATERLDDALVAFEQALIIDPGLAYAHTHRGAVHRRRGRFARALADHDRAAEIAPDDADVFAERGETYRQMGRFTAALSDFNRALAIEAHHPEALVGRDAVMRER